MTANPITIARAAITPALFEHPAATGAGVRVAILDTGLDVPLLAERHPAMQLAERIAIRDRQVHSPGLPSSLHGTTVADIILNLAPQVELYAADIFGNGGGTDVDTLIAAIRHAVDRWHVQVINLSLGVIAARLLPPARRQLLETIEAAYHAGVSIVAAAHNDHPLTLSLPATQAPPLLSVDKGFFEGALPFGYAPRGGIEFAARAVGQLGLFCREPATSWAAPHVTGAAARLLSLAPDLKPFELKTLLFWMTTADTATGDVSARTRPFTQ